MQALLSSNIIKQNVCITLTNIRFQETSNYDSQDASSYRVPDNQRLYLAKMPAIIVFRSSSIYISRNAIIIPQWYQLHFPNSSQSYLSESLAIIVCEILAITIFRHAGSYNFQNADNQGFPKCWHHVFQQSASSYDFPKFQQLYFSQTHALRSFPT